ncbi:MAG TPA: quinone-dependent dihydroorotate dehydrogenase [Chthoniobacterales bacterium]|jgi:dihydroorotate dehydrogenase|nr:quinone-dependent dihydroorotate dehydrogenase [Chthoniobacterales bacterium]
MKNAYERLVRPLLFSVDPETAHHFTISCLRVASHLDPILDALTRFSPNPKPKSLFGVNFPNPIGLAAGLDKNGVALPAWAALGFGFVEIGTVTAKAQPGNPKPRVFRFPEQQALINRLGFNNDGADAIAGRLGKLKRSGRWPGSCRVGINIGKSMSTPITEANADYLYSFQLLREFADYVVLNVSSPNTPGLRELQAAEALAELLRTIGEKNVIARKPIVVKIAPDLAPDQLEQIIGTCEANTIAAIIATNTTLDHSAIPADKDQQGGLSGAPVRQKSSDLVRAIAARSKIPVIASGGVLDADSAREKFEAGAQLVQIYTGLIYRGPGLLREIADAIA